MPSLPHSGHCKFTRLPDTAIDSARAEENNCVTTDKFVHVQRTASFFSELSNHRPWIPTLTRSHVEMTKAIPGIEDWLSTSTTPNEYLWAGQLLALYGYTRRAFSVYCQALEKIPGTDIAYPLITEAMKDIRTRCDKRIDFITVLPHEISSAILVHVKSSFEQNHATDWHLIKYTRVSKTWRHFLLNLPEMWKSLVILDYPSFPKQLMWYAKYLPGEHVRYLQCSLPMASDLQSVLHTIIQRKCDNLTSIDTMPLIRFRSDMKLSEEHVHWLLSRRLTNIAINADHFTQATIQSILNGQHDLEAFQSTNCFDRMDENLRNFTASPVQEPISIHVRHLILNISASREALHLYEDALISCTRLQTLVVICAQNISLDRIIQNVMKYCPDLQSLEATPFPVRGRREVDTTTYAFNGSPGLRHLKIDMSRVILSEPTLVQLVTWSHATLEVVHFQLFSDPLPRVWSRLEQFGTPQLQDVRIGCKMCVTLDTMAPMGKWLQDSPLLESLDIYGISCESEANSLFSTLKSHLSLKHMSLFFKENVDESCHDLEGFLNHAPALTSVSLYGYSIVKDSILYALSDMEYLKSIRLENAGTASVNAFCHLMNESQSPALSLLNIMYTRNFDPHGIVHDSVSAKFKCNLGEL